MSTELGDMPTPTRRKIEELTAWAEHWEVKARKARLANDPFDAYEYQTAAARTRAELAQLQSESRDA